METGTIDLARARAERIFSPHLRKFGILDVDFLRRAVHACNYGEVTVTLPQALAAIEARQLDYYIANERCGGGVWWKNDEQAWLVLFYREGTSEGLRRDCRLLRQGMEESIARHPKPIRLYAAVDAGNPHAKGLLFIHEKIFGLKPFQTVTRSDWIREP